MFHMRSFMKYYSSPNTIWVIKSRRMRCVRHVAGMGNRRGAYRVLMWRTVDKRPLGRPSHTFGG
jgi:hypothetical protein